MDARKQMDDKRRAKDVAEAQRVQALKKQKQNAEQLAAILDNPEYRQLIWWLLDLDSLDNTGATFTGNSKTFYNEGLRDNALSKQRLLKRVSLHNYHKMEVENSNIMNEV